MLISKVKEPSILSIAISTSIKFPMTKSGVVLRFVFYQVSRNDYHYWFYHRKLLCSSEGVDRSVESSQITKVSRHNEILNCNWLIVMTEVTIISDCS
jgi:hypothetical protein